MRSVSPSKSTSDPSRSAALHLAGPLSVQLEDLPVGRRATGVMRRKRSLGVVAIVGCARTEAVVPCARHRLP